MLANRREGFTLIEVLIVLAIAGIIMMLVFLAVPALQRSSRNHQRNNDASLIMSAINECVTNNNGNLGACQPGGNQFGNYIKLSDNQQLTDSGGASLNGFGFHRGSQCENNEPVSGGGQRAFAISYEVETMAGQAPRCVSS